ncbi:MAG: hypothetical protein JOZ99_11460 [Actinobacteria bacterium]|nr:hypothetical protein [Actinomycetota bacterium]
MKLGRKRARSELLDAVRAELEWSRSELRTAVADAVAEVEERLHSRLDERARVEAVAIGQLGETGAQLGERVAQFERALERISSTCDLAVHTVQMNRAERLAVLDALQELSERVHGAAEAAGGGGRRPGSGGLTVLGGTVSAGDPQEPPAGDDLPARTAVTPEQLAQHPAGGSHAVIRLDGVEVRCRFDGDHWVGGFEVAEVVRDEDGIRYRLRRRADGYELPRLFSDRDVRDVDPPHLREVPRR